MFCVVHRAIMSARIATSAYLVVSGRILGLTRCGIVRSSSARASRARETALPEQRRRLTVKRPRWLCSCSSWPGGRPILALAIDPTSSTVYAGTYGLPGLA